MWLYQFKLVFETIIDYYKPIIDYITIIDYYKPIIDCIDPNNNWLLQAYNRLYYNNWLLKAYNRLYWSKLASRFQWTKNQLWTYHCQSNQLFTKL